MLFSLISSYRRVFVSTIVGSVVTGWDQVLGSLVLLYGEGHMGLTGHAFYSEIED
ncbi:MAG: hypothetical protein NWE83_05890 [Candidatus Bathyarchaeota archaeon]|jgi:hypothetical protein|nr:hypothetical protein [Candidatus Bathyarchaeota archaeon]